MSRTNKTLTAFAIFVLVALAIVPTASAFEGREGGRVVIEADEVVEDDLYIGAETIIVDGIIKGDLYAGGGTITINGVVEGDLVTGAQSVIINGTVKDDLRAFAAAIQLGPEAEIGDDLLYGGASLEAKSGSLVGGDIVVGSAQVLVAGDVDGNILTGTSAFELSGSVAGDIKAYVDTTEEYEGMPPMYFGPQMNISIPSVAPGITIDPKAAIGGDLSYTAYEEMSFPPGVIAGKAIRVDPSYTDYDYDYHMPAPPTPAELTGFWALGLLRTIISLIVVGLLLGWLFPNLVPGAGHKLQTETWSCLGWGVVGYASFFFALLVIFTGMILGAIIFGFLSLDGLSGTIVTLGLLALFILIVGFILTVVYLTKIIVSVLGGKLILAYIHPEWVNHKVWPLVVGVVILATIMSIPFAGWLIKLIVVLFGLGALWILGREQLGKEKALQET